IKTVFLQCLPCLLRMSRPGKKITKKNILGGNRRGKSIELKEKSSKSLLANVLDIDDDIRHKNSAANPPSGYIRSAFGTPISTGRPATVEDTSASLPLSGMQEELHTILKELRFITDRMKKADESDEIISDWKFAAMVALFDRLHVVHGFGHDSDIVSCATHNRPINRLPRSSHRKNAQKMPKKRRHVSFKEAATAERPRGTRARKRLALSSPLLSAYLRPCSLVSFRGRKGPLGTERLHEREERALPMLDGEPPLGGVDKKGREKTRKKEVTGRGGPSLRRSFGSRLPTKLPD
ncbi:unnamed protein product, partial [Heterotrigona itama]